MTRHEQIMGIMASDPCLVAEILVTWETEIGKTMPADFKDWWENTPLEWPLVTRRVIESLRERESLAWASPIMKTIKSQQTPPGGCLARLVRRLTRWAWTPEPRALAMIAPEQKPPPPGKVRMYCAGWRDMTGIGWGDYYLHSIHPTPEAATAAIESLRIEHQWSDDRSPSCGQWVDVFWP